MLQQLFVVARVVANCVHEIHPRVKLGMFSHKARNSPRCDPAAIHKACVRIKERGVAVSVVERGTVCQQRIASHATCVQVRDFQVGWLA